MAQRGRFIVLDGPDGSGTTFHSARLAERLRAQGRNVLLTCEPTSGAIGRFIRELLKSNSVPPAALQLLFCADRAEHLSEEIEPALEAGSLVVSDRYIASTLAYGDALGLSQEWLSEVNNTFIQPDASLFLLPPLTVCLDRIGKRTTKDILEQAPLQARVHAAYSRLAAGNGSIAVIDTSEDKETVAGQIDAIVDALL